jgi:hypothetical protein
MRQVRWLPAKIRFEGGFTAVLFDSVSLNGHLYLMTLLVANGTQIHTETRAGVKRGCNRLLHSDIRGGGGIVYQYHAFSSFLLLIAVLPLLYYIIHHYTRLYSLYSIVPGYSIILYYTQHRVCFSPP